MLNFFGLIGSLAILLTNNKMISRLRLVIYLLRPFFEVLIEAKLHYCRPVHKSICYILHCTGIFIMIKLKFCFHPLYHTGLSTHRIIILASLGSKKKFSEIQLTLL